MCASLARGLTLVAALLALLGAGPVAAQNWPAKPVRVVVPWPPGGPADILGRTIAAHLSKSYGQQFVVDNRAGAAANVGAELVAKSAPDGYTLFLCPPGPATQNQFLYKNLPFNPRTDFTPIVLVAVMPLAIMTNPSLPVTSVAELVEYARRNPGKLNHASPGNGSMGHVSAEMFKRAAQIDIVHVPYRGSAPALQDLLSGRVEVSIDNAPSYISSIQDGRVRVLAVTTEQRWAALQGVPTMQELGFADYQTSSWNALVGPAKLPPSIVTDLNRKMNEFLSSAEGSKNLLGIGYQAMGGTPEDLHRFIDAELQRIGPIMKDLNLNLD